jgi:hypothetical protein
MKLNLKNLPFKKIGIVLLMVFVLMQFFRIDKTNPAIKPETDFIYNTHPSPGIANILKTSCYDCHSSETVYPWYSNVAPVSWWLKNHIIEARHKLNFSEWTTLSSKKADRKLKECVENVQEEEMPLFSYTLIHRDAVLSEDQRHALIVFFESLRTHESDADER